jgi:hypothetical protein
MLFDPVIVFVSRLALRQPIIQLQVLVVNLFVLLVPLVLLFTIEVVQLLLYFLMLWHHSYALNF